MAEQPFGKTYDGNPAASYERFFVPTIGAPLANDLIRRAELREGERVLDVACGTGVVAKRAAQQVGDAGTIIGLDINPGMLSVARASTPPELSIEWLEASADAMPLADESFDVVLCQVGLEFMPDKAAVLREMYRVLAPGGRLVLNLPGPTPRLMATMRDALARHVGAEAAGFVDLVFSLHDSEAIQDLISSAGFREVSIGSETVSLPLPAPDEFLWQYVASTPLSGALAQVDDKRRDALDRDVVTEWRGMSENGLMLQVRVVTATARK